MRHEPNLRIEKYRVRLPGFESPPGVNYGLFVIARPGGLLRVISSGDCDGNPDAQGWEHVSVSLESRCPTWAEMQFVKELFWADEETVVQFHPRRGDYVNLHEYCLHMWKRGGTEFDLPPRELIG